MKSAVGALNRKAWGGFALAAVVAAGWFALNLLAPDLSGRGIPPRLGLVIVVVGVVLYGLWRGLVRTQVPRGKRVAAWLGVAIVLAAWLAAVWTLAASGAFQ
ncbi:MAG TPA: hypothetical protein VG269_15165, partial [Tepidisphaeraceae bacterium]|nr:hypothetical protein [Tepidisphaeraceae bacterium]